MEVLVYTVTLIKDLPYYYNNIIIIIIISTPMKSVFLLSMILFYAERSSLNVEKIDFYALFQ